MPKAIVDAVLDRVIDTQEAVARAVADADATKAGLQRVMRVVLQKGASREQFREVFNLAVLAHLAGDVPDLIKTSRANLVALQNALNAAGPSKVKQIQALRKPDLMRRAAERAGAVEPEGK